MNIQEILQLAEKLLVCPICGRKFSRSRMKIRGFVDKKLVIQTFCTTGHAPVSAIFITGFNAESEKQKNYVSYDDVLDLRLKLEEFKGDIKTLFNQQ